MGEKGGNFVKSRKRSTNLKRKTVSRHPRWVGGGGGKSIVTFGRGLAKLLEKIGNKEVVGVIT